MLKTAEAAELQAGLQAGLRLEAVSLVWVVVEAAVSIGAGISAGSLLLTAFGVDSVVELASAALLFRRLRRQASGNVTGGAAEQKTARMAGLLLYALSVYVVAQAVSGLARRHQAGTAWAGIAVAVVAAFGMPVLARAKLRVAKQIGSRALRADAMETLTCGYLSWALLAGLAANALLHWWWLDSAAALAVVPLLVREGREAASGGCGCHGN